MWSWNYIRLPVVSGHPEERRDPILGVLPMVLGMFFNGSGCFWPWRQRGIVQWLAAQSGRKVWKNWGNRAG